MTDPILAKALEGGHVLVCFDCGRLFFPRNLYWHIRKVHGRLPKGGR